MNKSKTSNQKIEKDLESYLSSSNSWYYDAYESVYAERTRYFIGMIFCLFIIAGLVFSISKNYFQQEPITQVAIIDLESGTISTPISTDNFESQYTDLFERVITSEVIKYVQHREAFSHQNKDSHKTYIGQSSSKVVYGKYKDYMANSPKSPNNRLGNREEISVHIRGHHKISTSSEKNAYLVRFSTTTTSPLSKATVQYFSAVVHYEIISNTDANRRYENPIGFIVTNYQVETETTERRK